MFFRRNGKKSQKGAALVEYAVLIGAVTLIGLLGLSVLGHKTNDLTSSVAVLLPGAHADDNLFMRAGELVAFENDGADVAQVDITDIGDTTLSRLGDAVGITSTDYETLLVD
jgi:Flp pilus assembly pilin Flp